MSPTPRTDNAALCWERDSSFVGVTVPVEFARELERELAESAQTIAMLSHQLADKREIIRRLTA